MGRNQFVIVLVVLAAVAIAVAGVGAIASRGGHARTPVKPAAVMNAPGDDDANVMRQLQRNKQARAAHN